MMREDVTFEVEDDGGLAYAVERTPGGRLTVVVRVYGRVIIDGVPYEYDRGTVRVALKRVQQAPAQ
jgi:hypothetical protein